MYLTEIPELSANCMYSVVNVYMIVNHWDPTLKHLNTTSS